MGGTIPWIKSGEVNRFRIDSPTELITVKGYESSSTKLLPAGAVVVAITGATLGQVSRLEIAACANQSVVGIHSDSEVEMQYGLYWMQENVHELMKSATGGAQQHINQGNVKEVRILRPPPEIVEAWGARVSGSFSLIRENLRESRRLAKLRDLLSAQLLSGAIRVAGATRLAMAAP
jgi:type I restriction enzyme S subunit